MKSKLKEIFTVDPYQEMNSTSPGEVCNLLKGEWIQGTRFREDIPDPLNGEPFLKVPDTTEYSEFINSLDSCPKSGLHNPLKNVERYLMLGEDFDSKAFMAEFPTARTFPQVILNGVKIGGYQQLEKENG